MNDEVYVDLGSIGMGFTIVGLIIGLWVSKWELFVMSLLLMTIVAIINSTVDKQKGSKEEE